MFIVQPLESGWVFYGPENGYNFLHPRHDEFVVKKCDGPVKFDNSSSCFDGFVTIFHDEFVMTELSNFLQLTPDYIKY